MSMCCSWSPERFVPILSVRTPRILEHWVRDIIWGWNGTVQSAWNSAGDSLALSFLSLLEIQTPRLQRNLQKFSATLCKLFYFSGPGLVELNLFLFWLHCEACAILGPRQGTKRMPSALGRQSLSHWTTREVPDPSFLYHSFIQSFTIQQTFLKLRF